MWFFISCRDRVHLHHMLPQMCCLNSSIVTMGTFVGPLPSVHFHMSPQTGCMYTCIFTLFTFVDLLPTVRLHMIFHMGSISRWIVALGCISSSLLFEFSSNSFLVHYLQRRRYFQNCLFQPIAIFLMSLPLLCQRLTDDIGSLIIRLMMICCV